MPAALFDPIRHEPLVDDPWNEADARHCIDEIVAEAVAAYSPTEYYPPHPDDDLLTGSSAGTSLYFGATGVLWGIAHLSAAGAVPDRRPWVRSLLDGLIGPRHEASFAEGSALFGILPAVVMRARLCPRSAAGHAAAANDFDHVYERLSQASGGPVQELMWGIPGGALLAEWLLRETGEARWQVLLRRQLDAIWNARIDRPGIGLMWNETLYGEQIPYLGLVHGFAGQVLPLLRAFSLLSADQQRTLREQVPQTLQRTAVRTAQGVNWPTIAPLDTASTPTYLVQICHGAPGIVACFADIRSEVLPDVDELIQGAGDLIWTAGPLAKGSNLCHGTAGNGMGLLKLFARTGDDVWLHRARLFAMHCIRQYRQARHRYGRGRYSLWTGDMGVAIYLHHCISALAAFPTIDEF